MSRNDHHTFHRSLSIISNHHQIINLQGFPEPWAGQKVESDLHPRRPPLRNNPSNLSEYEHPDTFIFIFFDCRNSDAKDANDNRKRKCLKAWLIFAGIMLTVFILTAMVIIIYLFIIIKTSTTTAGENKVLFLKLKVYSYTSFLLSVNCI